jgi:quinol monooxygenase YgiN
MSDHVSFFRAKARSGKRQAVVDHFAKWERDQKSQAKGFIRSILVAGNNDPDAIMGAVRWDNTQNYAANSNRPAQDGWYRELLALVDGEPEWFDGTLLREATA